jgi:hypothetical protein
MTTTSTTQTTLDHSRSDQATDLIEHSKSGGTKPGANRSIPLWLIAWRWGRWALLLGLIALNAWWYWLASRPLIEIKIIEKMIDRRQTAEAELALRRRLEVSPHDGESRAMLARILAQRKDSLGCARELQKIPSWWPGKAKWLLMEGTAFKQVDRMREAETAWQAVVKDEPLHPVDGKLLNTATLDLLELFAVESRWSDAARLIWSVYDRISDPHDQEALLVMRMRTEMERITPAVAAEKLTKYITADPEDWEARRALAKVKIALNQPDEGKVLLEACLDQRPGDARGWADYLSILSDLGDLESLRSACDRIPAEIVDEPGLLKFRAILREHDRDWPAAVELYRRLVQARPWEREAFYRLAQLEDRLGHASAAREYRQRSENMRLARSDLNDAFQKVLDARRDHGESPELNKAIRRLSDLCRTLGWSRDADGWARLTSPE